MVTAMRSEESQQEGCGYDEWKMARGALMWSGGSLLL
jgi:hypothetical protein